MAPTMSSLWTQMFPPAAKFVEHDVPDLRGKVYIVTGATSGVGWQLARILYSKNAKVYIAARSEAGAITRIKQAAPSSTGTLVFLRLDLADLDSVKKAAQEFLAAETKLHVLFNNAGYMAPDDKTIPTTSQGYELQLGVHCLGPFLFTKLLTPLLLTTSKTSLTNETRVVFISSLAAEFYHEPTGGLDLSNLDFQHPTKPAIHRYGLSKVGVWAYGVEFSRRFASQGVLGVPVNPGNLRSDLFKEQSFLFRLQVALLHYAPVNGAYTELWAGLSPEVTRERAGEYVFPFGRFQPISEALRVAAKPEAEGGVDLPRRFWEWSEREVEKYV